MEKQVTSNDRAGKRLSETQGRGRAPATRLPNDAQHMSLFYRVLPERIQAEEGALVSRLCTSFAALRIKVEFYWMMGILLRTVGP